MKALTTDQRAALHASLEQRNLALLRQLAGRPNSESSRTPAVEEVETSRPSHVETVEMIT